MEHFGATFTSTCELRSSQAWRKRTNSLLNRSHARTTDTEGLFFHVSQSLSGLGRMTKPLLVLNKSQVSLEREKPPPLPPKLNLTKQMYTYLVMNKSIIHLSLSLSLSRLHAQHGTNDRISVTKKLHNAAALILWNVQWEPFSFEPLSLRSWSKRS